MKRFIIIASLLITLAPYSHAKSAPSEADYIVPTSAELMPYSRFKVKINIPYAGYGSTSISYTFPPELTGEPNKQITLVRDETNTNLWVHPEMTATCAEFGELFSCNIHLVKKQEAFVQPENVLKSALNFAAAGGCAINAPVAFATGFTAPTSMMPLFVEQAKVESFLKESGFTGDELTSRLAVARAFACAEPAGFLSYEF